MSGRVMSGTGVVFDFPESGFDGDGGRMETVST